MADIQFKRGEFQPFRAVAEVHLGAIQDYLQEGEVIEYDGTTMKRGPDEHQISNLKAAIKIGWLVPEAQVGGSYVAQPADVQIHDAQSTGRDRGEGRRIGTVSDEERDLGTRESIRKQARTGKKDTDTSGAAPTGAMALTDKDNKALGDSPQSRSVVTEGGQEGEVVGRLRTPASQKSVIDSTTATRVAQQVSKIDNVQGSSGRLVDPVKRAKATGDVQEAIAGDDLEELLPDAVSSKKPEPGEAGEGMTADEARELHERAASVAEQRRQERLAQAGSSGKAKVSASKEGISGTEAKVGTNVDPDYTAVVSRGGSSSIGGADDGEVVGKVGGQAAPVVEDDVPPEAIIRAKIEMIQQFVPGFEWDMSVQWAKRAKIAVEKYGKNMPVMNAILSIETEAVRKEIMKRMYGG